MEQERWKDIKGYNGSYQISDYGRVKSFKHNKIIGRLLKPGKTHHPYYQINLCLGGIIKTFRIARLTARHFISNSENKPQINHIDGNKLNNYYKNLEWVTAKENMQHAIKILNRKIGFKKGELCEHAKLTWEKTREIRELYKTEQYTQKQLGNMFGVQQTSVGDIINYRTWKEIVV